MRVITTVSCITKERRGTSSNQTWKEPIQGLVTTIPFVTPASPFLPPQQPSRIPFSPSPPHSASVSPTQHAEMSAQELAPAVHPLQAALPTRVLEHSRPSLRSSPLPSPHPRSSNSSPHHPHSNNSSPHSTYFPFPPHLPSEDHQQQHAQAQLPPQHHSSHQNL